ncbi:MAG: tRNA (adenosine(37)-N6)-threonylcarbamoyltransferase complex dimerization subunit type 1 TsaB [Planctomycetes bacterium]|nr:tRNA (adenosine(37)-N6)-threonylcarbamoyltransferase complex dimerization subunit type 1 TsaB [Planctomycetota bacterium]
MNGIILAIETSGDGGGAAVFLNGELDNQAEVSGPRRHGAELMKCVDKTCIDAAISRDQIDVIAVNCGPGSYTGLRIGLATAAALGFALDRPVIGVPAFDAMVMQYVSREDFDVSLRRELWPCLDARRDEVMTARFVYADGRMVRASDDMLVAPEKLHEQAAHQAIIFGSGVKPYEDRFTHENLFVDKVEFEIKPGSIAMHAWRQLAEIEDAKTIERKPVEPRYFRRVLAKTIAERASEV